MARVEGGEPAVGRGIGSILGLLALSGEERRGLPLLGGGGSVGGGGHVVCRSVDWWSVDSVERERVTFEKKAVESR